MNFSSTPSSHPLRPTWLALLCALYLLTGLLDHDLWKNEDAIHLGVAWGLAQPGTGLQQWLQPQLAGEVWAGAPLYHWLAAGFGKLFGFAFDFHNAARLATAAFGALMLFALGKAATLQTPNLGNKRRFDVAAPLLGIGTLGLLVPTHEAQPAIAALAGHALVYWGLARLPHARSGGVLLGLGISLAALAGGRLGVAPLLPLLLLLLFSPWRNKQSLANWLIATLIGGLLIGGFIAMRGTNAVAPFATLLGTTRPFSKDHFELLLWFAWPVWPLALWSVWLNRRHLTRPHILLPLIGAISSLLLFLWVGEPRALPSLPVLIPLILLATSGAGRLRRGAANAFDWFGMMTFTLVGGLVWLGGVAMVFGIPAQVQRNFAKLEPGFVASWSTLTWLFSAMLSIVWIVVLVKGQRSPWRATTHWACGVMLLWGLVSALWMPWIDYGKSYRSVAASLRSAVPANAGCVAGQDIGDPQRAAFDYHAGIRTVKGDTAKSCKWVLIHGQAHTTPNPGSEWRKVWDGNRPGDKSERFYLFSKR